MEYLCSVVTSWILGLLSFTWSTFVTKGVPASKILKKWPSSWSTQGLPTFEQPCHWPSVPGSPWAAIPDWTIFITHETAREWEMCTMEFNCLSVLFFLKQKNVVLSTQCLSSMIWSLHRISWTIVHGAMVIRRHLALHDVAVMVVLASSHQLYLPRLFVSSKFYFYCAIGTFPISIHH